MRVQRYGLFLIPPNIFGTFFQKMLFVGFETSIDEYVNAEVPDSSNRGDGDFVGY
jgi:hypothetical protein